MLEQLTRSKDSQQVLRLHVIATPFLALEWAVIPMIPILLREYFNASEWQTVVSTSAVPVMLLLSILWNELYRRLSTQRYLLVTWTLAIAPLSGISFCHRPGSALFFVVISAAGIGALTPLNGDLLRCCYARESRARILGIIQIINKSVVMLATYGIGVWLHADPEAFRMYMPASVVLIGIGAMILNRITHQPIFKERHRAATDEPLVAGLKSAWRNMWQVFVDDRDFRRYEIGYFIYGLGWMICTALLPFLVVDHLNLNYEQIARSTHTILELTLIVMMVPAGHWVDRFGPIRIAGLAFLALTLYPVGLMLAVGPNSLMLVTICYGIGLSGVHLAWTIGPITLAKHPSHAPHYLAIHATMVGFRALIGQYSAVALYTATGIIELPLVLASLCFFIGAVVMFKLYRDHGTWESTETPPAIDSDAQQRQIPSDVPADNIKD